MAANRVAHVDETAITPPAIVGTLGGNRTPSLLVRSQTLYPLSYEGVTRASSPEYSRRGEAHPLTPPLRSA